MISAICFDFDGTLVDSNAIKKKLLLTAAHDLPNGSGVMRDIVENHPYLDRFGIFDRLAKHYSLDDTAKAARINNFNKSVHNAVVAAPFMPGVEECLIKLSQRNIHLFLNSATPEEQLIAIVEDRGISHLFEGIYGRPNLKHDNIRRAAESAQLPSEAMLMVGDGADDQDGARKFGCAFQAVFSFRGTVNPGMSVLTDFLELLNQHDLPQKIT